MSSPFQFSQLLQMLAYQTPRMFVCVIAFVVALFWIRRCPKPALATMAAMGIMGLSSLVGAIIQAALIHWVTTGGAGAREYSMWISAVGVVRVLADAFALALLTAAVFMGRQSANQKTI